MSGRLLTTDISQSTKLASLSWKTRELFFYIIPHFNVHGKMNGDPHYIKGQCVPLLKHQTVKSIKDSLKEITEKTSVVWYQCDKGLWWLKSLNFQQHQPGLRKNRCAPDNIPEPSRSLPGVIPPELELEVEEERTPLTPLKKKKGGEVVYTEAFLEFWSIYPRKTAKGDAFKAWKVIAPTNGLKEQMAAAVEKQKKSRQWTKDNGQFIPLPATWLRQRRWEDELQEAQATGWQAQFKRQIEREKEINERDNKAREEREALENGRRSK